MFATNARRSELSERNEQDYARNRQLSGRGVPYLSPMQTRKGSI